MSKLYIRLDGDDIGKKIELMLFKGEYQMAQSIHDNIQETMLLLRQKIQSLEGCKILMYGCDDIMFTIDSKKITKDVLLSLMDFFSEKTSSTISIGIGNSSDNALKNLQIAKLSGKGLIYGGI